MMDVLYALTVQQPYASLIMLPDGDSREKRVENRVWKPHSGLCAQARMIASGRYGSECRIAIHAGKGRDYIGSCEKWGMDPATLPFGMLLGTVRLQAVYEVDVLAGDGKQGVPLHHIMDHPHTDPNAATWLHVTDPRPFARLIPCKGALGWWCPDIVAEKFTEPPLFQQEAAR